MHMKVEKKTKSDFFPPQQMHLKRGTSEKNHVIRESWTNEQKTTSRKSMVKSGINVADSHLSFLFDFVCVLRPVGTDIELTDPNQA